MKKLIIILLVLAITIPLLAYLVARELNSYQLDGEISFSGLDQTVTVHRDEKGIPYIFASSAADAIRAQGFIAAQDRVFQIELYRALIKGELAAVIGEAGLNSDISMRVVGLYDNAVRHVEFLDDSSRQFLQWYAEGYNEFVQNRGHEFPFELSLLGLKPTTMSVTDLLAVQHFAGYVQSRNYQDEILSLQLLAELGAERAEEIRPLNINPDRSVNQPAPDAESDDAAELYKIFPDVALAKISNHNLPVSLPALGSNNWVTGASKSVGEKPILSNDPHLDASVLPGPWFPVGLFTDEISAIGASLPGVPGIMVGRNSHIAFGVTNAYGDSQDLYIEQPADNRPGHYKNGSEDLPFKSKSVNLRVKDSEAADGVRDHEIVVRYTVRGPIISDHEVFGIESDNPIVLRTAAAEVEGGSIGLHNLLSAQTVAQAEAAFAQIDLFYMNYLVADQKGNIAHRPTGAIPKRDDGATAKVVDGNDDWQGFVAKNELPGSINPRRDWLGTSNHDVIPDNYPHYYSTHFSPNYRYLRTSEWMNQAAPKSAADHWSLLRDTKNKHAERLMPTILAALAGDSEMSAISEQLAGWDFVDDKNSLGPAAYHLIHEYLVRVMLEDKLSPQLANHLLQKRYYWLQRFDELILNDDPYWGDLSKTEARETINDLIVQAANKAKDRLASTLGDNPDQWLWGPFHEVSFVSPLRQSGFGSAFLGGGTHHANGSGETLNRGQYSLNGGPYRSQWFSSMRMVADLNDDKKIMASISGGNAARQFHPYYKSQLDGWLKEEWSPWWLDRESVETHSEHQLRLLAE
ncbi:MAG: penicillin acylase family protein [Pseudomonadota bacterium]